MKTFNYLFLAMITCFIACENNIPIEPQVSDTSDEILAESQVRVEENVLIFSSSKDLQNTINRLHKLSPEERDSWGKALDFTSQQTILDRVIKAEEKIENDTYSQHAHLTEEEFLNLNLPTLDR
ncbi:MAG: hypothetical protein AAF927_25950 [Bacteroidota bacterium]